MKKIIFALVLMICFSSVYATSIVFNTSEVLSKFKLDDFEVTYQACTPKVCWSTGPADINQGPTVTQKISDGQMPNVPISLGFFGSGETSTGKPVLFTAFDSTCTLHGPYDHNPQVTLSLLPDGSMYKISCVQQ